MNNQYTIIITLGTRDIAISPNLPDDLKQTIKTKSINNYIYPLSPRNDGYTILQNFNAFSPYLELPIINPFFSYFQNKFKSNISHLKFLFIATDQPKLNNNEFHFNNDTIYYPDIISLLLQNKFKVPKNNILQHFIIQHPHLNLYDKMFDLFYEKFPENLLCTIALSKQAFLLPQGGIDAINTCLMLFLNERAGNIIQLYINENQECQELSFPKKYKLKLIEKLLQNYEYESLLNIEYLPKQTLNILHELNNFLQSFNQGKTHLFNIKNKYEWAALKLHIYLHQNNYLLCTIFLISLLESITNELYSKIRSTLNNKNNNTDKIPNSKKSSLKFKINTLTQNIHLLNEQDRPLVSFINEIFNSPIYHQRNTILHTLSLHTKEEDKNNIRQHIEKINTTLSFNPSKILSEINQKIKNTLI